VSKEKIAPEIKPRSIHWRQGVEDEINIQVLFSALEKLTCVFELKDSLPRSFSENIMDERHNSHNDVFAATESWLGKYSDTNVTHREMIELIKYVKLNTQQNQRVFSVDEKVEALEVTYFGYLVCPFRSSVLSWGDEIRKMEARQKMYSSLESCSFKTDRTIGLSRSN